MQKYDVGFNSLRLTEWVKAGNSALWLFVALHLLCFFILHLKTRSAQSYQSSYEPTGHNPWRHWFRTGRRNTWSCVLLSSRRLGSSCDKYSCYTPRRREFLRIEGFLLLNPRVHMGQRYTGLAPAFLSASEIYFIYSYLTLVTNLLSFLELDFGVRCLWGWAVTGAGSGCESIHPIFYYLFNYYSDGYRMKSNCIV